MGPRTPAQRQVLMFDLGGVLIRNDMFSELRKLLADDLDEASLKVAWLSSPAAREFELGHCTPTAFGEAIVEEFGLAVTPDAFLAAFSGWPKGFYPGADALLRELRQHATTGALSNSNELHWTSALTESFDHAYSSHLLHRIKPDAEVFDFVTRDLGVEPGAVVFFDDSTPNVAAARAFGWQAHLTVGFDAVCQELRALGLTR